VFKMLSFGCKTCKNANSPLVNRQINDTVGCVITFQLDATSNLIRWFSVFDECKQAGDGIFSRASLSQKLSEYDIILQSYCTNKRDAFLHPTDCVDQNSTVRWRDNGAFTLKHRHPRQHLRQPTTSKGVTLASHYHRHTFSASVYGSECWADQDGVCESC